MPLVYTQHSENSLLDNAWRQAVARQIEYSAERLTLGDFRKRL